MPESAAFDALAREFFSVWLRYHPGAALAAGLGDYGRLPAPQSDDDHAALGGWLETLVVALQELDHAALDPARRLDAELMFALAVVEHRELLERDWRRRDPLRYVPLTEIHRLTLLRPATLRDDLLALLEAIPAHLRLAMTQLTPMAELIPPPLVTAAIRTADAGPGYLRALAGSRWLRAHCHGSSEIEAAAERAAAALRQYATGLRSSIAPRAAAPCGCGAEHLSFLLHRRHRLEIAPADCAPMLDALLQAPGVGAGEAAADTTPGARDKIGAECAHQETLLRELGLFRLPAASLRATGGPVCPRLDAARLGIDYVPDLVRGQGTLYLADRSTAQDAHSLAALRLRCLELGWGGLHTLTFAGGMAARSLPRLLAGGSSLTRGWPLALLGHLVAAQNQVTAPSNPSLLAHLVQDVRRAAIAHARLDLDLHLGRIDLAQAHARATALGDADQVLAELIQRPGDALAAVLGWQLIEAARGQLRAGGDEPATLRGFHDSLLRQGPVPASMALATVVGEATAGTLMARLTTPAEIPA